MTKEQAKRQYKYISSPSAIAKWFDMCVAYFGWDETEKLIAECNAAS